MVVVYDTFATIAEAYEAINRHVLDEGESYRVYKTDTKRYILLCKDMSCSFTSKHSAPRKPVLLLLNSSHIRAVLLFISDSDPNSELERELAPFANLSKQGSEAKDAIIDEESELSDLRSSNFEGIKEDMTLAAIGVETGGKGDSRVGDSKVEALASPALQLRPKRVRLAPARYQG
jgi:hypothetical protein